MPAPDKCVLRFFVDLQVHTLGSSRVMMSSENGMYLLATLGNHSFCFQHMFEPLVFLIITDEEAAIYLVLDVIDVFIVGCPGWLLSRLTAAFLRNGRALKFLCRNGLEHFPWLWVLL